jgi:hypothetical protein
VGGVAIGIWEVFAYSVPGAIYLTLVGYVLERTGAVDVGALLSGNAPLTTVGAVLASYLLGHITYFPRRFLDARLARWLAVRPGPREEFTRRVPAAAGLRVMELNPFVLQRGIELVAVESSNEISRLRASGVALRNVGFALVLAAVAALVELVVGGHRTAAALCLAAFPAAAWSALRAGFIQSHWAALRTYEMAFWLPQLEERLSELAERPQHPR